MVLSTLERTVAEVEALQPRGPIWNRKAPVMGALVRALAAEAYAATLKLEEILLELDPRTTSRLLPVWERIAGLPDPCALNLTTEERRSALVARLTRIGGSSRAFLIDYAAALGFTIWIEEHEPEHARCGEAVCGESHLEGDAMRFLWTVHAPETTVIYAICGTARCGDPLGSYGNELLECALRAIKPAHTEVGFAYDSEASGISMLVPGGIVQLDGLGLLPVPGGGVQTNGVELAVPGGTVPLQNDQ